MTTMAETTLAIESALKDIQEKLVVYLDVLDAITIEEERFKTLFGVAYVSMETPTKPTKPGFMESVEQLAKWQIKTVEFYQERDALRNAIIRRNAALSVAKTDLRNAIPKDFEGIWLRVLEYGVKLNFTHVHVTQQRNVTVCLWSEVIDG